MLQHFGMQANSMMHIPDPQFSDFDHDLPLDLVKDHSGKTLLHHAVIDKNKEQVQTLLHAGGAVNVKDYAANDPLHYAAMAADPEIVDLLVRFGADINAKGQLGRSPLHMAVSVPSGPVVDALIKAGAEVSSQDDKGDTPLHLVLAQPSSTAQVKGLVNTLLQARADVNIANAAGFTSFHKALQLYSSSNNDEELVLAGDILRFLEQGSSATKPFPDGAVPLTIYLQKSPTQWKYKDRGWSWERDTGTHKRIMTLFLGAGASPTTPMPSGEPMAHYYFRKLHNLWGTDTKWAERLCNLANPSHVASNGNTLLHEVLTHVDAGSDTLIDQLLRNGADPNCQNHAGQTPMHILFTSTRYPAKTLSYIENAVTKLLAYGADPWVRDVTGTCAHYEVIRKVSKFTTTHSRLLLKADLQCRQHHEPSSETGTATARSQPWPEWVQAIRAEELAEATELIFRQPSSIPGDVEKDLQDSAYAVLAEKFLDGARAKFMGMDDEAQERRRYIANILRDCRARSISIDMRYYDDLLQLC
jgi:ankyrin repeat protein